MSMTRFPLVSVGRAGTAAGRGCRLSHLLPRALLLAALLTLQACAEEKSGADRDVKSPAERELAAPAVTPPTNGRTTDVPSVADAPAATEGTEREQQRRLADAQSYFDRARDAAQARRELALRQCREGQPEHFEECEASADQSLEAELRAARVEFDAQMMQPQ